MDALKLLSRSTNLRSQITRQDIQHIPSEGGTAKAKDKTTNSSKKRKRVSENEDSQSIQAGENSQFSEETCRRIQNEHKIRIVDLRRFRPEHSASRKSRKESSRIFPQPLLNFQSLGSRFSVAQQLAENVAAQGYFDPTEVQLATLPLLLDKTLGDPDLLTIAPTGSGKTLAYLVPLIQKIRTSHQVTQRKGPRHTSAIVLAPTKELVNQIVNEGRKLSAKTGISITATRKGMELFDGQTSHPPPSDSDDDNQYDGDAQFSNKNVKVDILVSTPLSILSCLFYDEEDKPATLQDINSLILDEADVLLDPLFREQTIAVWKACISPDLRVSLWSATIGSNIEELAISFIAQRQQELQILDPPRLLRTVVGLKDTSLATITHRLVFAASEPGKLMGLRQLLHPARSASGVRSSTISSTLYTTSALRPPFLIFTQTIDRASALYEELLYDIPSTAGGSSRIAVLHSSLSDSKRSDIMAQFRTGQVWVLITTDLLSRGVDFRGMNGVVNYDIPTTAAAYIHRAGRTGRAGRLGGVCITFYAKDDIKYVKAIANIITASQSTHSDSNKAQKSIGLENWVLDSLPDVNKRDRKELKARGVPARRAIKESDNVKERRSKRKARIGTKSGYEKKRENNIRGAVLANQRKANRNSDDGRAYESDDDEWAGVSD